MVPHVSGPERAAEERVRHGPPTWGEGESMRRLGGVAGVGRPGVPLQLTLALSRGGPC